jgi:hypothetical protein
MAPGYPVLKPGIRWKGKTQDVVSEANLNLAITLIRASDI